MLAFHAAHSWRTLVKYARFGLYGLKTWRIRSRVDKDPAKRSYMDLAITPVVDAESEALEMFDLNAAARVAVEKARRQAQSHLRREAAAPAP